MTAKIESGPSAKPVEALAPATVNRAGAEREAVAAAPPADSLRLTGEAVDLRQAMARERAQPASIDVARVNQIRAALDAGSYRIDPQEIATRLLALERELLG